MHLNSGTTRPIRCFQKFWDITEFEQGTDLPLTVPTISDRKRAVVLLAYVSIRMSIYFRRLYQLDITVRPHEVHQLDSFQVANYFPRNIQHKGWNFHLMNVNQLKRLQIFTITLRITTGIRVARVLHLNHRLWNLTGDDINNHKPHVLYKNSNQLQPVLEKYGGHRLFFWPSVQLNVDRICR